MHKAYKSPRVKPKIRIFATGKQDLPWIFQVRWPRRQWINSFRNTFGDALKEVERQLRKDKDEART